MKLTNQDIWLAYSNLTKLSTMRFPVDVSMGIAWLCSKLQQPYAVIESERQKLVNYYGTKNGNQVSVLPESPQSGDFAREFGELLTKEWPDEFEIQRVKLPSKITVRCADCDKSLDIDFLIEPNVLIPLREHFISLS